MKWAEQSIVRGPLPQPVNLPKASKMETHIVWKTLFPKVAVKPLLRHFFFLLERVPVYTGLT